MRIGVLGCGPWGANHARCLSALGVLAAVADIDPGRSANLAAKVGANVMYPHEMADSDAIDAVVLAMPPQFHTAAAVKMLYADKHVLVEKPMALTLEDATAVVRAAQVSGCVAMTGHLMRFHPAFERLAELVQSGAIGPIRHVETMRMGFGRFYPGVDVLWDLAPHDVALLLALIGENPTEVRLEAHPVLSTARDIAHLHLTFPDGVVAHCHMSRASPRKERRLTVIGAQGMVVFDDMLPWEQKLTLYRAVPGAGQTQSGPDRLEAEFLTVPQALPLDAELGHFIAAIRTGAPPRSSVQEGLEVIRVIRRAEASLAGARPHLRPVSLNPEESSKTA